MSYSEEKLKEIVRSIFQKYDKDGNKTLDRNEITSLINAVLQHYKADR
jgi:Ca2+-binding EF-hand superfamily protein